MKMSDGRVRPPQAGFLARLDPSSRRAPVAHHAPGRLRGADVFEQDPRDDQHPRRVVEHHEEDGWQVAERQMRDTGRRQRFFT